MPDPTAETAKSFVLAGAFWLAGTIIFLVAAYKVYQPRSPLPQRPAPDDCGCL
jgi:hypothetical protein